MREAETKTVELPEEDEEVFSLVLSYLYEKSVVIQSPKMLGRIYTAAEKYQIDSLKICIIRKVKSLLPIPMADWLDLCTEVYENLAENDQDFRRFFVHQSVNRDYFLKEEELESHSQLGTILCNGGFMALDIGKAYALRQEKYEKTVNRRIDLMKDQHRNIHSKTASRSCCLLLN